MKLKACFPIQTGAGLCELSNQGETGKIVQLTVNDSSDEDNLGACMLAFRFKEVEMSDRFKVLFGSLRNANKVPEGWELPEQAEGGDRVSAMSSPAGGDNKGLFPVGGGVEGNGVSVTRDSEGRKTEQNQTDRASGVGGNQSNLFGAGASSSVTALGGGNTSTGLFGNSTGGPIMGGGATTGAPTGLFGAGGGFGGGPASTTEGANKPSAGGLFGGGFGGGSGGGGATTEPSPPKGSLFGGGSGAGAAPSTTGGGLFGSASGTTADGGGKFSGFGTKKSSSPPKTSGGLFGGLSGAAAATEEVPAPEVAGPALSTTNFGSEAARNAFIANAQATANAARTKNIEVVEEHEVRRFFRDFRRLFGWGWRD